MVNLVHQIWAHSETRPHHVAVRTEPLTLTYAELQERSARWAGAFTTAGIGPGDAVLLLAPTVAEFPVVELGLHAVGASVITMNTMATATEIGYVADDAGVRLVVAWHGCREAADRASAERDLPLWPIAPGAPVDAPPVTAVHDHDPDDAALILYTSGTTGRPKGAELTAANLLDTTTAFVEVMNLTPDDRSGTALPLFHVFGQCVVMHTALVTGATLSLLSPFDPAAMIAMTRDHELTTLSGVPTMWNAMLHAGGDVGPQDFAHLRLAGSGGASLPVQVIEAFEQRFGAVILEGYGLTETTGAATFNDINRAQKVGTVGPALPGTRIEVRDVDGTALPAGEIGEVFVSGPTVMRGYRDRPEDTAVSLREGWLATGDLGTLDDEGYLSIVDRTKDLIIRGGYNVYPREVEEVLYTHPDVVEVAVVGVPDEAMGEVVAAAVVLADGATGDGPAMRVWAKEQLSAYKVPTLWAFVDTLPKGATGKILKRAIDRTALVAQKAEVGA